MLLAAVKGVVMVLLIVAQNGFRDEEYFKPNKSLKQQVIRLLLLLHRQDLREVS